MRKEIPMVLGEYSIDGRIGQERKENHRIVALRPKKAEEWYAHFLLQQSSVPTITLADFWEIYKAGMKKRLQKTIMKEKEYWTIVKKVDTF